MEKPFEDPSDTLLDAQQDGDETAPELTLNDLSLEVKVQILFDLCEFLMENIQSFHDHVLKGYDAGIYWRLEPLGRDVKGLQYWVFDDGRLFREQVDAKTGLPTDTTTWELVCYTIPGWQEFKDQLSNKPSDRKLKTAIDERWAEIEAALIEQDKVAKKKARELYSAKMAYDLIPRKRSSRLQAKEAMQKLRDQEEEEERAVRLKELAESNKSRGLPPPMPQVTVPGGLTREERAEQRRLRLEREANEKVLKELEAEHAGKEEKVEVDVVTQDVQATPPLKITIRRSSIPNIQDPTEPPKKKKPSSTPKAKPATTPAVVDPQKQKMLELMEQAIQRELAQRLHRPLAPQTQNAPQMHQFVQQRPQHQPQQQQQYYAQHQQQQHQQYSVRPPQQQYQLPQMAQQQYAQYPQQQHYGRPPMMNPYAPMQQRPAHPPIQHQRPPFQGQPGQPINQQPMMPFQSQQFQQQQHQQQYQQQQMHFQQYQPRPMYNAPVVPQMPAPVVRPMPVGQPTPVAEVQSQQIPPQSAEHPSDLLNNEQQ